MFEYDIAYRRSVAVQCMLYKIRFNPMPPLNGVLSRPYVPVRVTRGALVEHRYTYGAASLHKLAVPKDFYSLNFPSGTILLTPPAFDGMGLAGFKSRENAFYWPTLLYPYYSIQLFFPFSSFCL